MSWLFDKANDTEREVADILLQLPALSSIEAAVPGWGFKRRVDINGMSSTASPRHRPPHQFNLIPTADHRVAVIDESYDEKPVTDDKCFPFIEENYSSEIKAKPSGLAPSSTIPCIRKGNVKRIKFKLPRPEKSPQVRYTNQSKQIINDKPAPSSKEDVYIGVMVTEYNEKNSDERAEEEFEEGMAKPPVLDRRLVGGSRKIEAEPTTMLEANPFIPHKKTAKRKWQQEMENEVVFWENNKRDLLESICKVKDFLEKKKALNSLLKARKQQLIS